MGLSVLATSCTFNSSCVMILLLKSYRLSNTFDKTDTNSLCDMANLHIHFPHHNGKNQTGNDLIFEYV